MARDQHLVLRNDDLPPQLVTPLNFIPRVIVVEVIGDPFYPNCFLEDQVGDTEGDCQKSTSQSPQTALAGMRWFSGLDWPEDHNTVVHGDEDQKEDTGWKVKDRHGAI